MAGKEDKFTPEGELAGGYDVARARRAAVEHAAREGAALVGAPAGLNLNWVVESARFSEEEDCYVVRVTCQSVDPSVQVASPGELQYHIDARGMLLPGTPKRTSPFGYMRQTQPAKVVEAATQMHNVVVAQEVSSPIVSFASSSRWRLAVKGVAFLIVNAVLPGLGSILGGAKKTGIVQLTLTTLLILLSFFGYSPNWLLNLRVLGWFGWDAWAIPFYLSQALRLWAFVTSVILLSKATRPMIAAVGGFTGIGLLWGLEALLTLAERSVYSATVLEVGLLLSALITFSVLGARKVAQKRA